MQEIILRHIVKKELNITISDLVIRKWLLEINVISPEIKI